MVFYVLLVLYLLEKYDYAIKSTYIIFGYCCIILMLKKNVFLNAQKPNTKTEFPDL